MRAWRKNAEVGAADSENPARPVWFEEVPHCSEACPHFDGKRCALLGLRAPLICEPVVREMAQMLDKNERALPAPERP